MFLSVSLWYVLNRLPIWFFMISTLHISNMRLFCYRIGLELCIMMLYYVFDCVADFGFNTWTTDGFCMKWFSLKAAHDFIIMLKSKINIFCLWMGILQGQPLFCKTIQFHFPLKPLLQHVSYFGWNSLSNFSPFGLSFICNAQMNAEY